MRQYRLSSSQLHHSWEMARVLVLIAAIIGGGGMTPTLVVRKQSCKKLC